MRPSGNPMPTTHSPHSRHCLPSRTQQHSFSSPHIPRHPARTWHGTTATWRCGVPFSFSFLLYICQATISIRYLISPLAVCVCVSLSLYLVSYTVDHLTGKCPGSGLRPLGRVAEQSWKVLVSCPSLLQLAWLITTVRRSTHRTYSALLCRVL